VEHLSEDLLIQQFDAKQAKTEGTVNTKEFYLLLYYYYIIFLFYLFFLYYYKPYLYSTFSIHWNTL